MTAETTGGARVIPIWTLPDRIRKAREHAGYSQQELADALSVTRTSVINWERGHTRPLLVILHALADLTGVEREWLTGSDFSEGAQRHKRPHYQHQLPDWTNQEPPSTSEVQAFLKSTPLVRDTESTVARSAAAS